MGSERFLAVDVGSKWVGFALGDKATGVAGPLYSLERKGNDAHVAAIVERVAREEQCRTIVLGMPNDGVMVGEVTALTLALQQDGYEVGTVDEHLTSRLARTRAAQAGVNTRAHDDAWAAVLIAEDWIGQR